MTHWYTLIRHPSFPDEYYVFNNDIIEHRQFGTRFPLRDDPYHPDYEPFCITLTPAISTQGLPSIPEQTEGAGPFNIPIPCTPSVQSADLHTPRESQPAESSKEGDAAEEVDSEGSPEHPHTPEEADPPTYHPQVPKGHEQLAAPPEVQQIKEELEQLFNINIIAAHHLPPILQVLPPDPPQILAPPAPQVVPIFMANFQQQQQQQPPPPQQPTPQSPAGAQASQQQQPAPPANGKWNGTPPKIFTGD